MIYFFSRFDQGKEEGANNTRNEIWDINKDTKVRPARLAPYPVSFLSFLPTECLHYKGQQRDVIGQNFLASIGRYSRDHLLENRAKQEVEKWERKAKN